MVHIPYGKQYIAGDDINDTIAALKSNYSS